MPRLIDNVLSTGIRPAQISDSLTKEIYADVGLELRRLADLLNQAETDAQIQKILDLEPFLAKTFRAYDKNRNTEDLQGKKAAFCRQIASVENDADLGRAFRVVSQAFSGGGRNLKEKISGSVVVAADEVARFVEARRGISHTIEVDEFGAQAPLFPKTFIEFDTVGDFWPCDRAAALVEIADKNRVISEIERSGSAVADQIDAYQNAKWVFCLTTVMRMPTGQIVGPLMHTYYPVLESGRISFSENGEKGSIPTFSAFDFQTPKGKPIPYSNLENIPKVDSEIRIIAMLTIGYAHAFNIELEDVDPNKDVITNKPGANRPKTKKSKTKKKPKKLVNFKTIKVPKIREMTNTIESWIREGVRPSSAAIVKGHYKEFTEDKPMFGIKGRFGLFFYFPYLRGDLKDGIELNDYDVGPPAPTRELAGRKSAPLGKYNENYRKHTDIVGKMYL